MSWHAFNNLARFVTVFCTCLLISCSMQDQNEVEKNPRQQALEEAQYWLNQHNESRAIEVLEPWWNKEEVSYEQNQVRLLLASAHVARSGIELSRFVNFLKELRNLPNNQQAAFEDMNRQIEFLFAVNPSWKGLEDLRDDIFRFYRFLYFSGQILQLANTLPKPKNGYSEDLKKAIFYLSEDNELMSPGSLLYRAALRLFLINDNISKKVFLQSFHTCPLSLAKIENDIYEVRNAVLELILDLQTAIPNQNKSLEKIIKMLRELNLRKLIKEMEPESFKSFIKVVEWIEEAECNSSSPN